MIPVNQILDEFPNQPKLLFITENVSDLFINKAVLHGTRLV